MKYWLQRLKTAITTSKGNPLHFVFHLGYQGFVIPRSVRWAFRKTEWHRAWFVGYTGLFIGAVLERQLEEDFTDDHVDFLNEIVDIEKAAFVYATTNNPIHFKQYLKGSWQQSIWDEHLKSCLEMKEAASESLYHIYNS
jgi:hypothetical protein